VDLYAHIRISKRVYVIGNGGSFANASHIVNDLLSVGVKAYSMDPATLTAFSNDYGYEEAFSKWIGIVGEPDDLLIALSGSGKSPNILKAIQTAEAKGMSVYREFGAEQGLGMQDAEERQIELGHEIMLRYKNAGSSQRRI
jgi:D-sedoheptulose 7-phosphate isomerase